MFKIPTFFKSPLFILIESPNWKLQTLLFIVTTYFSHYITTFLHSSYINYSRCIYNWYFCSLVLRSTLVTMKINDKRILCLRDASRLSAGLCRYCSVQSLWPFTLGGHWQSRWTCPNTTHVLWKKKQRLGEVTRPGGARLTPISWVITKCNVFTRSPLNHLSSSVSVIEQNMHSNITLRRKHCCQIGTYLRM